MKKIVFVFAFVLVTICRAQTPTINITEVDFNSDSTMNSGNWFEIYNYGASTVDLSLFRIRDSSATHLFLVPPGITIGAGQYLVFCSDTVKFDNIYNISNRVGDLGFQFGNSHDGIRIYDNTNTLVTQMFYTDSIPWQLGADGYGRTLQILNNTLDPNDPNSWRTGCVLGSPGTDYIPCVNETLVVSEINYKSAPSNNPGDWIEIRNIGSTSVNIGNYIIRNHKTTLHYTIPFGTILAPQGNLVIYNTPALFLSHYPLLTNAVGPFLFGMDGNGDCIRLYNASDKIIFSVYYNDDPPWPNSPDGFGYTLESDTNFNFSRDVNNSNSWFAGCPQGSPGVKFDPACIGGIENTSEIGLNVYPNPASEFIQVGFLQTPDSWVLKIYNTAGQPVIRFVNQSIIPVDNLANGIYILEIEANSQITRKKILIAHE